MKNSRLYQVSKTLSKDEWKRLRKYHLYVSDDKSDSYKLYKYLTKYRDQEEAKQLNIDYAHSKLFPRKTRKGFQNVMSKLSQIQDEFLRWEWFRDNENEFDLALLRSYNSRGLFYYFNLKAAQVKKRIKQDNNLDIWGDLYNLIIHHMQSFSDNPTKTVDGEFIMNKNANELITFSSNLSRYYISAIQHQSKLDHVEYSDSLDKLRKFPKLEHEDRLSSLLDHLNLLITKRTPQSFNYLFKTIKNEHSNLSTDLKKALITCLIRYATNEYKTGSIKTPAIMLELYEIGIETGSTLVNQKLSHLNFINYVNIACACKEFAKAKTFVKDNQHLLSDEIKGDITTLSKAQIAFMEERYGPVIKMLRDYKPRKNLNTIRVRWLLLCSHFMINKTDKEFISSVIRNFETYIRNNKLKISKSNYLGSLNLARILKRLIVQHEKNWLLKEINNPKDIVFRSWLRGYAEKYFE